MTNVVNVWFKKSRPQNDGPAERASSFILLADSILKQSGDDTYVTGTLKPAIFKDLDYVVSTWSDGCFDLWEEANGVHFYTLIVMRKGLIHGANFATRNGDNTRASTYTTTANTLKTKIDTFWSSTYITVTQSLTGGVQKAGYDVSTLIAANSGSLADGFYTPGSDKILATAVVIESKFSSLYDINVNAPSYLLGTAIGRYPEDTYNGNGNGHKEWTLAGQVKVSSITLPFFKKFDTATVEGTVYKVGTAAFNAMTQNVALGANKFLSTVKNYALTNGSMSEQYERGSGKSTGARDLTWSHAALNSAARAKAGAPSA
ncbi:Six-hairpin glycosidase-like protein [Mucor mucedo]|uniref:Six-hairpin glycosidase-like protein n=1 Tax=Mucor mucedo TaxID=29922 RepID=UPI00221FE5D4|nr:Six-hairpin glycosidase-like protein [Mucor mucedo]KAI7891415.1 Six-hairpin glycosidase-like protein [Mucor mucedo]